MVRHRALQVLLVLVGLLFLAAIYPVGMSLWHFSPSDDHGDTMMLSLYFTLGVFMLAAVRKPSAYRSVIAFAAWSSFAHGFTMTVMGFHLPKDKSDLWIASAVLAGIGLALLALLPPKEPIGQSVTST